LIQWFAPSSVTPNPSLERTDSGLRLRGPLSSNVRPLSECSDRLEPATLVDSRRVIGDYDA